MKGFVSGTRKVKVHIGGRTYTDEVISGQVSHDSSYTNNIITCKGQIVIGNGAPVDLYGTAFPAGTAVNITADYNSGRMTRIPMGSLLVLSSYGDPGEITSVLDVGCSLAFLQSRESIFPNAARQLINDHIDRRILDAFDIEEFNLNVLDSLLKIQGDVIYQTNRGIIKKVKAFGENGGTDLTCIDKDTVINLGSLSGSIEDVPKEIKIEQVFTVELEEGTVTPVGTQVSIFAVDLFKYEGTGGGTTAVSFEVRRSGVLNIASSVGWEISGGTIDDADLPPNQSGVVSFDLEDNLKIFTIQVRADDIVEQDETLTVRLVNAQNCTIGVSSATVGILNDDKEEEEDDEEEEEDFVPPIEPFLSSELTRTILSPTVTGSTGLTIENRTDTGEGSVTGVPTCGTLENPGETAAAKYAYVSVGEGLANTSKELVEQVTSGQWQNYAGIGNQIDREITFEYTSAMTYAESLFNTILNKYVTVFNEERQKADALLSKANQYYQLADDFNSRDLTDKTDKEKEKIRNAIKYYNCSASQMYEAGEGTLSGATNLAKIALNFIDKYESEYGVSSMQVTDNYYNDDATIKQKIVYRYVHKSATKDIEKTIESLEVGYRTSPYTDKFRYRIAQDIDFSNVRLAGSLSFDYLVRGSRIPQKNDFSPLSHHTGHFSMYNNLQVFKQKIVSKSTTTYEYGEIFNTETTVVEDFETPSNSSTRVSRSTNNTAEEEDRLIFDESLEGGTPDNIKNPNDPLEIIVEVEEEIEINEEVDSETTQEEVGAISEVQTIQDLGVINSPTSWFGPAIGTTKVIRMPFEFRPMEKHRVFTQLDNGYHYQDVAHSDSTAVLDTYQSIAAEYVRNETRRITADRSGIRVTETLRSEMADYHPYFRVSVNLSSTSKTSFKGQSNVCNVVFDNTNVLVSFDLFGTGSVGSPGSPGGGSLFPGIPPTLPGTTPTIDVSPNLFSRFVITEGAKTLNNDYFNLPVTIVEIVIKFLPATGTVTLNGNTVSIDDVITTSDIAAGNVLYTPLTNDSTPIEIAFTGNKADGNEFDMILDLFPSDSYLDSEFVDRDGGDFDNNTTNEGDNVNAGTFEIGGVGGGNPADAGNFDTGIAVQLERQQDVNTIIDHIASDPNVDGPRLVDGDGNNVPVDTLPEPVGINHELITTQIDFRLKPKISLRIKAELSPQPGFNYSGVAVNLGTPIDFGSVTTPNSFSADFGTVSTPLTPVVVSSVI